MTSKKKRKPVVDRAMCAACGECAETCPRIAITIRNGIHAVVDYSQCVGCGACAAVCPASAISMKMEAE
ncbi:MAG: 4Fe-4S binding protein [Deltaproteobacteria bacterium]|jgi:pyruvate ferredoxin oxidoreductase delta subunit|nr:4Fe-4S binding protein [Deltaproteobacteria bacterium]